MSIIGRIHSFESCGTVDGPGIRFITFFQGCLMRCLYCHNRDTWDTHGGKEITVEELMKEVVTYRHFMNASGGGVTASGGEAILQAEYLAKKNINVWIRYVVVPGWSDDDDSAHRLGEFTRDMGNVEKIELLPYHELGKHKWVAMGEEYKLDGVHPPKKETMERVKGILEQYGHKVMY